MNINGLKIPVVGLADPDYEYQLKLKVLSNGTVIFESGFCLDLLNLLQFTLNFTYKAIEGEGWIDELPNGSWTGIGRQVYENEASLAITQSSIVSYRLKAFSFLMPTTTSFLLASFRQPPGASSKNIVTSCFPLSIWIGLFISGFLVILSIKLVAFIRQRNSLQVMHSSDQLFFDESFFWVLGTFCHISLHGTPSSNPLRIIYASLLITSFIAYVAFSASLVSHLALENVPIRSFADLIKSDMPIYGDISAPYTHEIIEELNKGRRFIHTIQQGVVLGRQNKYFTDVSTGIQAVMRSSSSFITFKEAFHTVFKQMNLTERYICQNIYQLRVNGMNYPSGMFVKKGSPLKEVFNPKITMLYERGFVKRLHDSSGNQGESKCIQKSTQSRDSLGFDDILTLFVILVFGSFASCVFWIFEIVVSNLIKCTSCYFV